MSEQHLTPFKDTAVTATATLMSGKPTRIYWLTLHNLSNAIGYLQLFDAAAATDVTLGTTAPTLTIGQHQNNSGYPGYRDLIFNNPLNFKYGVVYAFTTTATGNSAPSANSILLGGYV